MTISSKELRARLNFTKDDKPLQLLIKEFKEIPYFAKDQENYYCKRVTFLSEQMNNKEFRITVVGEYSAGKSTFLNALIGKDILPHAVDETTATITYIRNVPKHDPRLNKIQIHFHDKSKVVIELDFAKDPEVLKNFTTTKSKEISVVDEIAYVTIYVHFTDIDEPIVFVDTPGLNGVAKGHRELTMHEIKQAHASVCLFHLRSISTSNLEFLKVLTQYQRSFLFVMNFIDELKSTEGETYEGKMESFRKDLLQYVFETNENVDIQTYGISALKGLVSKDTSIKRLYQDDMYDLSDLDRQRIWAESKFSDFEKGLWEYVANGEKNRVFEQSIVYSLHVIFEEAMEELEELIKLSELSINSQQRREIEGKMDKFEKLFERNWEKVSRFISSRENDLEKAFRQRIEKDMLDLIDKMSSTIQMASFDEFEEALKVNQYGNELVSSVSSIKHEYQENLAEILEEIYQSAILRIKEYNPSIEIEDSGETKLKNINKEMETDFTDYRFESKIEQLKSKGIEYEIKKQNLTIETLSLESELTKVTKDSKKISLRERDIEIGYQQKQRAIGSEPRVERREVQRTKTVERATLSIFRLFGSTTKEVTVTETITDTSKRDAWVRRKEAIKREFAFGKDELQREAVKLKGRIESLNKRKLQNSELNERITSRLEQVEQDIARKKEEYTEIIQKAKSEYLRIEKKKLIQELSTTLTGEVTVQLKESIKENIRKNMIEIVSLTEDFYQNSLLSYKRRLELLIEENGRSKDSQELKEIHTSMEQLKTLQDAMPTYTNELIS